MISAILGGLVKIILDPIVKIFLSLTYGLIIRGPLETLNYLDLAFKQVSGANVDQLLFSTSITTDGSTNFNFFTSNSPLKTFFLIMLGVSSALLVIFLGFILLKSIINKKSGGPVRKAAQVSLSGAIVFVLPTIFLMILSLAGSVLSTINNEQVEITSKNISTYQSDTKKRINRLQNLNKTAKQSFDNHKINGLQHKNDPDPVEGEPYDPLTNSLTLDEIYNFLIDSGKGWIDASSQVITDAQSSQSDYIALKNALVKWNYSSSTFILNADLDNQLKGINSIIDDLTPKMKDETKAEQVKALQDQIQDISDLINNWKQSSQNILFYETGDGSSQDRAVANFRRAYEKIYGNQSATEMQHLTSISNIQQLNSEVNSLINGDPYNPGYGLINLRQHLSAIQENSLVVTFYQLATGNKDSNWNRAIAGFSNDGSMLVVGFFVICAAIIIMAMASLFAVTRIFDLALLFIISPVVVTLSAADEGSRMKTWMNMVIAKLISIFGIVISLRLFTVLNDNFRDLMIGDQFEGGAGYTLRLWLSAVFGIGGLLAAYKASQTLSAIVGAGYGIMEGMQMGQISRIIKGSAVATGKLGKVATKGGGKALGLSKGKATKGAQNAADDTSAKVVKGTNQVSRTRLGSIKQNLQVTWGKRNQKLAQITRGKIGTKNARQQAMSDRTEKLATKRQSLQQRNRMPGNYQAQNQKKAKFKDFKQNMKDSQKREKAGIKDAKKTLKGRAK